MPRAAFTLLEVLVAAAVFFMVVFSVLQLVTTNVAGARAMQKRVLDCAMVAAELSITNKLDDGSVSGDFGTIFPGYTYTWTAEEVGSNGLFRVDIEVSKDGESGDANRMSILMYRAGSRGRLSGGGL